MTPDGPSDARSSVFKNNQKFRTKNSTGIKETTTEPKDFIDFSKPYDVYSIDGRKLTPSHINANSIVIIRQNSKVIKMRIR